MTRLVLISGLIPYDAGKTWFTVSSALAAKVMGIRVGVFKPVAAHNLWYSPKTLRKSIELGLLVGNDILEYYNSGLVDAVSLSNPIALATAPPDPYLYKDVESYMRDLESAPSTAVLSRFSNCSNGSVKHYVYLENLGRAPPRVRRAVERAYRRLNAEQSSITEALAYLSSPAVEENLNACLDKISRDSDIAFVESFNDAIAPYVGVLDKVDFIAVVAPGRVLVYTKTKEVRELVSKYLEDKEWEGLRSRYFVERAKAETSLEVGLALKPKPSRAHSLFIKLVTGKV
ncbi:MAG: hypothetical protein QXK88_05055 [Desulfurococcaceae archaeon]